MRWIWSLAAVASVALFFVIDSPGLLALDIVGIFVFGTLAVFAFAAARIDASARSEMSLLSAADLEVIRARGAAARSTGPGDGPVVGSPSAGNAAVESSIEALRARAAARRERSQ